MHRNHAPAGPEPVPIAPAWTGSEIHGYCERSARRGAQSVRGVASDTLEVASDTEPDPPSQILSRTFRESNRLLSQPGVGADL